jgi:hypothetical protein
MIIKLKKFLVLIGAMITVMVILVPPVAAYEGNVIKVRAHVVSAGKATRSPGWWQTHPSATQWEDLMGVFWSSQTFETNPDGSKGMKRDSLCKAKTMASFQVLAAILNNNTPYGAPLPVSIPTIREIMAGDDEEAIKNLHDLMSNYNDSGDVESLSLGIPDRFIGNATPGTAQALANETFTNCR